MATTSLTGADIDTSKRLTHTDLEKIVAQAKLPGVRLQGAPSWRTRPSTASTTSSCCSPTPRRSRRPRSSSAARMEWVSVGPQRHQALPARRGEDPPGGHHRGGGPRQGLHQGLAARRRRSSPCSPGAVRPATIYKKQKLDRDDLLDITDVNVVAWLKAEMRLMIEEELARAILVGDGRAGQPPRQGQGPDGRHRRHRHPLDPARRRPLRPEDGAARATSTAARSSRESSAPWTTTGVRATPTMFIARCGAHRHDAGGGPVRPAALRQPRRARRQARRQPDRHGGPLQRVHRSVRDHRVARPTTPWAPTAVAS